MNNGTNDNELDEDEDNSILILPPHLVRLRRRQQLQQQQMEQQEHHDFIGDNNNIDNDESTLTIFHNNNNNNRSSSSIDPYSKLQELLKHSLLAEINEHLDRYPQLLSTKNPITQRLLLHEYIVNLNRGTLTASLRSTVCTIHMEYITMIISKYPEACRIVIDDYDNDSSGNLPIHIAVNHQSELRRRRRSSTMIMSRQQRRVQYHLIETLLQYYPESVLVRNNVGDLPIHIALRPIPLNQQHNNNNNNHHHSLHILQILIPAAAKAINNFIIANNTNVNNNNSESAVEQEILSASTSSSCTCDDVVSSSIIHSSDEPTEIIINSKQRENSIGSNEIDDINSEFSIFDGTNDKKKTMTISCSSTSSPASSSYSSSSSSFRLFDDEAVIDPSGNDNTVDTSNISSANQDNDVQQQQKSMAEKNKDIPYSTYLLNDKNETPLMIAIENNIPSKYLYLLIQSFPGMITYVDKYERLPLVVALEHRLSIRKIQVLVEAYPAALLQPTYDNNVPLHIAASNLYTPPYYDDEEIITNEIDEHDTNNLRRIIQVEEIHNRDIIEYLVHVYPGAVMVPNQFQQLPFHCALCCPSQHRIDIRILALLSIMPPVETQTQLLADGKNNNNSNNKIAKNNNTFQHPQKEQEDEFRQEGDDDNDNWNNSNNPITMYRDEDGEIPLHYICRHCDVTIETVQFVHSLFPDGIAIQSTKYGHLPLHLAAGNPDCPVDVLQYLIDSYPTGLVVTDNDGDYPLICTLSSSILDDEDSYNYYNYLEESWPDQNEGTVNPRNANDRSNIFYERIFEQTKCLINAHPPCILRPNPFTGLLPLHVACQSIQSLSVVQCIIEAYPDALTKKCNRGYLPLHYAIIATCNRSNSFGSSRVTTTITTTSKTSDFTHLFEFVQFIWNATPTESIPLDDTIHPLFLVCDSTRLASEASPVGDEDDDNLQQQQQQQQTTKYEELRRPCCSHPDDLLQLNIIYFLARLSPDLF